MPEKKRGLRRYTAEECALIRREYAAFVPVREIGNKLGRNANDIGQKIRHLGLRRSKIAWKKFSNAPEHLKALAGKIPADEWRAKFHSWQSEQSRQAREQKLQAQAQAAAKGAEIDAREDLTRREKMAAKQAAGMSLRAIGEQYGITKQGVHEIINYVSKKSTLASRTRRMAKNPRSTGKT